MSLYIKFDGKNHKNVSRPWELDIGAIRRTHNNGKMGVVTRVLKTDHVGKMWHVWPNHDMFRFGLAGAHDDAEGFSQKYDGYLPMYGGGEYPNFTPFPQPEDTFYPHYEYSEEEPNVAYYDLLTPPNEGELKFCLRSCNYRMTKRYEFKVEIEGDWLSVGDTNYFPPKGYIEADEYIFAQTNIEDMNWPYWEHNDGNYQSSGNITDGYCVIKQSQNTSINGGRQGKIIFRQYNQDYDYYTGKIVIINIKQHRDVVTGGDKDPFGGTEGVDYQLTWYLDSGCTSPTSSYGPASAAGGIVPTYFTIKGTAQTWSGQSFPNSYYGQYPDLNENVADVGTTIVEGEASIASMGSLGEGKFFSNVSLPSNEPTLSDNDLSSVYIANIEPETCVIPADETRGEVTFQVINGISTEEISITEGAYISGRDGWVPNHPNTVKISQSGASKEVNVSADYDGLLTATHDEDIDRCDLECNGETFTCIVEMKGTNTPELSYGVEDIRIFENDVDYDVLDKSFLYFKVYSEPSASNTSEKTPTVTVSGTATYGSVSADLHYAHSGATGNTTGAGKTYLNSSEFSANASSSETWCHPGGVQPGINANEYSIPLVLDKNNGKDEGEGEANYKLSGGEHFKSSGNSFVPTTDKLPATEGENQGVYYIQAKLEIVGSGTSSASPRVTEITLNVDINNVGNIYSQKVNNTVTQRAPTSETGTGNVVEDEKNGFILENITDSITKDYIGGVKYLNGFYYIPIVWAANGNDSNESSDNTIIPSRIEVTKEKFEDGLEGLFRFKIWGKLSSSSSSSPNGGSERPINFRVRHIKVAPTNTITTTWDQLAKSGDSNGSGESSENEVIITPDTTEIDITLTNPTEVDAKLIHFKLIDAEKEYEYRITGTPKGNVSIGNYKGRIGNNGDWTYWKEQPLELSVEATSDTFTTTFNAEVDTSNGNGTTGNSVLANYRIEYKNLSAEASAPIKSNGSSSSTPSTSIEWSKENPQNATIEEVNNNTQKITLSSKYGSSITQKATWNLKEINFTIKRIATDGGIQGSEDTNNWDDSLTLHFHDNIIGTQDKTFYIKVIGDWSVTKPLGTNIITSISPDKGTGNGSDPIKITITAKPITEYDNYNGFTKTEDYKFTGGGGSLTVTCQFPKWNAEVVSNNKK